MAKKSYFKERTPAEINDMNLYNTTTCNGLTQKINDLDPTQDAIEIRTRVLPGRFYRNTSKASEASRKCYKHGDLIVLGQPKTLADAIDSTEIPLQMRYRDFSQLKDMHEKDINFVGYSFRPVFTPDRTRRIVNFTEIAEGARLYAYAEQMTAHTLSGGGSKRGIKAQTYPDSKRARTEGATSVVQVPSRTKKQPRYQFQLTHLPIIRGNHNLASVLSLDASDMKDEKTNEPIKGKSKWQNFDMRYTWANISENSQVKRFDSHQIAAYMTIIRDEREKHNLTPLEMNPFALPSLHQKDFYLKLCNNVIIIDPTLSTKHQRRKLHQAEKSILLARAIGQFGHDEFAFWDPIRDGSIRDYDWQISE